MATIFYVLDNFCPRSFYDTKVVNNDTFYIVVNTYLIAGYADCPKIEEYMNPDNQSNTEYSWKFLPDIPELLNSLTDPKALIPIPPPVNTKLSFSFNGKPLDNKNGFEFTTEADKVEWLQNSNSFLLLDLVNPNKSVNYLNYVNYDQFVRLSNWLIACLTGIFNKTESSRSPLEKQISLCQWANVPVIEKFKASFSDMIRAEIPKDLTLPLPVGSGIFSRYIAFIREHNKTFPDDLNASCSPEILKFSTEALNLLKKNVADITLELGSEKNYRKILFDHIYLEKNNPAAMIRRLQFYYGSGERLRIREADATFSFMVIKDSDTPDGLTPVLKESERWVETNAYSLCGQVCAIPLTELRNPNFSASLKINNNGVNLLDSISNAGKIEYELSIKAYLENLDQNDIQKLSSSLQLLTSYDLEVDGVTRNCIQEKSRYYPVNVFLTNNHYPVTWKQGSKYLTNIKIPEAILDALISTPRVCYQTTINNDKTSFLKLNPQRQFIRKEDLFKDNASGVIKDFKIKDINSGKESFPLLNFTPGIILTVQVKKTVLPQWETGTSKKWVYKISRKSHLRLDADKNDPDLSELLKEVNAFRTLLYSGNTGDVSADKFTFWISKPNTTEEPVQLTDIWVEGKIDADELLELYTTALDDLFKKEPQSKDSVDADLIILPAGSPDLLFEQGFNLLLSESDQSHFLALDNEYQYRFNLSVNGFSQATGITLDSSAFIKSPVTEAEQPLLIDFSNFNKLRLSLINDTALKSNEKELKLNDTDASLPLSEQFSARSMFFQYRTTHRFSEEVNKEKSEDNEESRYHLYRHAGDAYVLKAKIENQYAFRIEVKLSNVYLPCSNPLKNIAELATTPLTKNEDNEKELNRTLSLVSYSLNTENTLVIALNPAYLQYVFAKDEAKKSITVFRELYEAISDTLNSTCSLIIECWNFDNSINILSPDQAAHPELSDTWPTILPNLKFAGSETMPVDLHTLLNTLNSDTFSNFKNNIIKILPVPPVKVQFSDELKQKINNSTVVRVGLLVKRDRSRTIGSQFVNPPVENDLKPFPLATEKEYDQNLSFYRPAKATSGLLSLIDENQPLNRLYQSFSYLNSEWFSAFKSIDERKNLKPLLGEMIPFIWRKNLQPNTNKTDTLLYYIPYSFRPLKTNTSLSDLKTTLSFTEYLLRILAWIAYPERQKENPADSLVFISHLQDKKTLWTARQNARRLLQKDDGIAGILAELVTYVDNRPTADLTSDIHYKQVISSTDLINADLKKAFTSMFIDDPLKFITARGFGLGLFSGYQTKDLTSIASHAVDSKMNDLFMVQLIKDFNTPDRIGRIAGDAKPKNYSLSKINFTSFLNTQNKRYFIETLENAQYDNEFKIADGDGNANSSSLAQPAVQGRTAEDILEKNNLFNAQGTNKARVQIAHFCPDWRTTGNEKFYLLPSRRPPSTPLPYTGEHFIQTKKSITEKDLLTADEKITVNFGTGTSTAVFTHCETKTTEQFKNIQKTFDQRWDLYLTLFDFIVEADEKGQINEDLFEIYFSNDINQEIPTPEDADAKPITEEELFKQYQYYIRKQPGVLAEIPLEDLLPKDGTPGKLEKLLKELLQKNTDGTTKSNADYTLEQNTSDTSKYSLNVNPLTPFKNLVCVQAFSCKNTEDAKNPGSKVTKYLIRIKMLTDPWVQLKCRLRIRRNIVDIADNGNFGINPDFILNSDYSPWSSHGIQQLSYDYLSDPQHSSLLPRELKYLTPERTMDNFLDLFESNKTLELGKLIEDHLSIHNSLFNIKEITNPNRICSVTIENRLYLSYPQLYHKNKSVDDILTYTKAMTDNFTVSGARGINGEGTFKNIISNLKFSKTDIKSREAIIRFTWYDLTDIQKEVFSISWKLRSSHI